MIKAICFDLDGVYFTSESFQRFKKKLQENSSATLDEVTYAVALSDEMMNFKRGILSEQQFRSFVIEKIGLRLSLEQIKKHLADSYEVNQEVKNLIQKLKSKGYKICVCSNNFVTRVETLEERFHFFPDFDVRIFAYELGYLKPEKEIFEKLVQASGVLPQEIVYSDDKENKLAGAKELGISTFVYENFDQFVEKLREFGIII